MLEVFIIKVDDVLDKDCFNTLLQYVSDDKKERIRRFRRIEDAQRTLLGDILARYAICKRFGIKNSELVFTANEYGKPLLIKPHEIHFNISHSGDRVVCAIDDRQVGIDVEAIRPIDLNIAERFFSKDEYTSLMTQPEEKRAEYFYKIWTLKESYIKAEGKGLHIQLDSFTVEFGSEETITLTGNEMKKYTFFQTFLDKETIYAVCSLSNTIENVYRISISFLKEVFYANL